MVPGGDLENLMELRYDEDPARFHATILRALKDHFPVVLDYVGSARLQHAAFVVGQAIVDDVGVYDERFCSRTEAKLWEYLRDVTEWNNQFLQVPPPMNVLQYLVAASMHKPL